MESRRVPRKHLYSRASYLYQAASYISRFQSRKAKDPCQERAQRTFPEPSDPVLQTSEAAIVSGQTGPYPSTEPLARVLLSQLRGISLKAQIRLGQDVKHSICKRCHQLLISGITSTARIENHSRNGAKPWANVLVVRCTFCNTPRRFPVGAKRQRPRKMRSDAPTNLEVTAELGVP